MKADLEYYRQAIPVDQQEFWRHAKEMSSYREVLRAASVRGIEPLRIV